MNPNRFEYTSHWGSRFISETADLSKGVTIEKPANLPPRYFAADIAEMTGFHATNVHPTLNGFQGYDTIDFTIIDEQS